ncbi:MAG: integrase domain-containing protein [Gammaproteobacteria bacterium]|nr:integrase domain-containing protein [Gammaproteobacteria bacterium]
MVPTSREYVTNEDRSVVLDPEKLALVKDPHVAMALRMEAEFGLRREEAIKFTPSRDDRGDRIRLKGSTTKGGRPRKVPVRNESQRRLLDEACRRAGGGALIPPERNYKQQLKIYETQTRAAGLYRMHGLRDQYAQTRYEGITGWKPPVAGGHAADADGGAAADRQGGAQGHRARTRIERAPDRGDARQRRPVVSPGVFNETPDPGRTPRTEWERWRQPAALGRIEFGGPEAASDDPAPVTASGDQVVGARGRGA